MREAAERLVRRQVLDDDPLVVAPRLLGLVLVHGARAGRIVEVEAYRGAKDPASHAFRGRTARNATMFGRPGLLYVYFTYGMHFCCNVVCGPEGEPGAVLLRALEPVRGQASMRRARLAGRKTTGRMGGRAAPADAELCRGPANLARALGLDRRSDGADLCTTGRGPRLVDDGESVDRAAVAQGPRVGISVATEVPWRFWVTTSPAVSAPPRAAGHKRR